MKIPVDLYDELSTEGNGVAYEGFEVVEAGDWISDYKWENKRTIIRHEESGKFFALYQSRSGSYYSEYYYDEHETDENGMVELQEVTPVEKTIIEYI